MGGIDSLSQPPWSWILIGVGCVFALWALYLALPTLARSLRLLANVVYRRSDARTLTWLGLVLFGSWTLVSASFVVMGDASPELKYYVITGVQLIVVVLAVLAVVSFITWATMFAFELGGRPLRRRAYVLFIGWHMLRSHREEQHQLRPYDGGRKPPLAVLLLAIAVCAAAWMYLPVIPWIRWFGVWAEVLLDLRWAFLAMGVVIATWLVRREVKAGVVDNFDRLENSAKNLPSLLAVTSTTFISIVGVGVGVWALVVVLSVMSGFENDLRSKILATNPHVVIQDQEPMAGIPDIPGKIKALSALDGVESAIPYVQGEVIVTSRDNRNVSVKIRGIAPSDLAHAEHHLAGSVIAGELGNLMTPERVVPSARWLLRQLPDDAHSEGPAKAPQLTNDDDLRPDPIPGVHTEEDPALDEGLRPTILLGAELATSLRVGVGQEVTVVSPRDDAGFLGIQPRARTFRVGGIFRTGMYEFDLKLVYVRLSEAQRFFHLGGDINRIELRLADEDRSGEVLIALKPILDRPSLEALDWKALNKNLFSALALEKIVMFVVLGFIILVASFNVIGSLVMIIMEKSREIAILKSMGATSGEVRRMFLVLGGFIGGIGSAAGAGVGLVTCWFIRYVGVKLPPQYYIELLPVHVDLSTVFFVFLAGIALCLLATIYPASEAARIHPVEGLRYD